MRTINFKEKQVLIKSIIIDGIDRRDYPDFCDAYITYAEWSDGSPLSDEDLEEFADENVDLTQELAYIEATEG